MLGPIDDFLMYRTLGLSTIPCEYAGKRPKLAWKEYQQRIATVEEITEWCKVRCNVAIVTGSVSKLAVIDVDSDKAMGWARKNLPEPQLKTRTSKGEHWPYRLLEDLRVGNRAKIFGIGLDFRGEGGYVLAAPSKHPSGAEYQRLGDWSKLDELPVFDPSWIAKEKPTITTQPRPIGHDEKLRRAIGYSAKCPAAVSGQNGHGTTLSTALKLVRNFDLSFDDLMTVLLAYNERCEPQWTKAELEHKAAEAIRIVKSPVSSVVQQTRSEAMSVALKNMRVDTCQFCNEKKLGYDLEVNGKSTFYCEGHAKTAMKAHSGLKKNGKKEANGK